MSIAALTRVSELSGQQLQSVTITTYKVSFVFNEYQLYIEIDTSQEPTDLTVDNFIPLEIQNNLLNNRNDTLELAVADRGSNALILQFRVSGTIIIAARANIRIYFNEISAGSSGTSGAEIEVIKTSKSEETITELQYNQLYHDQQCFVLGVINRFITPLVPSGMSLDEMAVEMPSITLLRINTSGSGTSLTQQFKAVQSKEYIISFRMRGNSAVTVGLKDNSGIDVYSMVFTGSTDWRDIRINVKWTSLSGLATLYIKDTETDIGFIDITSFSVKTSLEGTELIRNGFFQGSYTKGTPKENEWILDTTANENAWSFLLPIENLTYWINPWKYITAESLEYFIKLFDSNYFDNPIERSISELWDRVKLILNNYLQINWNIGERINNADFILNSNVAPLSIKAARDSIAEFIENGLTEILNQNGENQQVNIGIGIQEV